MDSDDRRKRNCNAKKALLACLSFPAHDPEKWVPVFGQDHAQFLEREPLMSTLDAVLARIDQDIDQSVERLFALLRIASISTDPAYKEQCRTAAEHAGAGRRSIGLAPDPHPTEGHPVVVGKSNGAAGPHVLFYGHYDVQPVDPLNQWKPPPFEPR